MTEIRVDVELPDPPERVWRALTDPRVLSEWFLTADLRPEPGARFTMDPRGTAGFDDELVDGEVVEADPPNRLVMRWRAAQLQTVVTMTVRRTGQGSRLSLTQHGFVGPRGTLRRRVLQRTYASMFGDPLRAALEGLEQRERARAAQARRRGGTPRAATIANRRNDARSFRRIPRQAGATADAGDGSTFETGGPSRYTPDIAGEWATGSGSGSGAGAGSGAGGGAGAGRRRTAIRRTPDGRAYGRAVVPPRTGGVGRAPAPAVVAGSLGENEPTLALPNFPVRVGSHVRRTSPRAWIGEARDALFAIVAPIGAALRRTGTAARGAGTAARALGSWARGAAAAGRPGEASRRPPVVSGAALLLMMAIFTTLLDRAIAPHPPAAPQVGGVADVPGYAVLPGSPAAVRAAGSRPGTGHAAASAVPPASASGRTGAGVVDPGTSATGRGTGQVGSTPATSGTYRTGQAFVGGYQGVVTINNLSSAPLAGWTATVTLPPLALVVHDVHGAQYQQVGKDVRFTPAADTRVVAPGMSIDVTFQVQGVGAPVACSVNGQPCSGLPG